MALVNFVRKSRHNRKYRALILSGGAARGAYEYGVWGVFREKRITFDGFAGTSVGALNAALMAQDDYDLAGELYERIGIRDVLTLPDDVTADEFTDMSFKERTRIYQTILTEGGLDTGPLVSLLKKYIDEKKIRESGKDFGLVTFAVPQFKPVHRFIEDIPQGELYHFLLASASVPFLFKGAKVGGQLFTDGGVFDNLPVGMMKQRGYRDLTLVDVSAAGVVQKIEPENTRMLYIKNGHELPGILDFTIQSKRFSMHMGQLDAMKVLGDLEGMRYYIRPGEDRHHVIHRLEEHSDDLPREDMPEDMRHQYRKGLAILEATAAAYGIPLVRSYGVGELVDKIAVKDKEIQQILLGKKGDSPVDLESTRDIVVRLMKEKFGEDEVLTGQPPIFWLLAGYSMMPSHAATIKGILAFRYPEIHAALVYRRVML